jgi:glycosyltransferase involved in cell wall biosynthesis
VSSPTVSILIPTYNCARYLLLLCESIQRQTYQDFEVVIWDDGSVDNTAEAITPFLRDTRFQYLRAPKNQGVSRSWIELLSRARGEFWCSPGADDILFPDFLARRLARMREDPGATLIHGPPIHIDENGNERNDITLPVRPPPIMEGGDVLLALLQHNFINEPSTFMRRATTERVMPRWQADWKYAQDWQLWILHAATGQRFLYDEVPANNYRIHSQSLSYVTSHLAIRRAEIRLVPLVACSGAASISAEARSVWSTWRRALRALWLRRAWVLRNELPLDGLLSLGAGAFDPGTKEAAPHLAREMFKRAPEIAWFSWKENQARKKLSFPVSGLAQIGHPLFTHDSVRQT